jgi:glycosyltransferase involved in cell wall biosynthesis
MPVFNAATTVRRAVESIRRQTLPEWELIAVDDGSGDGTASLLKELAAAEPRLRVVAQPHAGIVGALDTGLKLARSGFIARMDADDEAHPERLHEQMALLRDRTEVGVVGSLVRYGGDRLRSGGYALHVDWINELVSSEDISLSRFIESPLAHPSVLFRRHLLELHGGYQAGDFPEDYELWLRWLECGVRLAKVPRELLTWHDPPDRLSRQDARYGSEAFYRCKAIYLARWLKGHVAASRRILVWGAGRPTRRRAGHLLNHGVRIDGYIDIDPRKIGHVLDGRLVICASDLPVSADCFVLGYTGNRGARELARSHLRAHGFVEGRDFLMAA